MTQALRRVGVLISGRGSNLQALIDGAAVDGAITPRYEIVLVISNRAEAAGLARAAAAGIPTMVVAHGGQSRENFDGKLDRALRDAQVEIVALAGFMRILTDGFVQSWEGRLINIHPSLLPAFKGAHVHERVIAAGATRSGASVHFVVPELDAGPVIAQAAVPVHPSDTPETLAERVLEAEHRLYPAALALVAQGTVRLEKGLAVFS